MSIRKAGIVCIGIMAGILAVALLNQFIGCIAYIVLSWPQPNLETFVAIFKPRYRLEILSGAALGAATAVAWFNFTAKHYQNSGNMCIIVGAIVGLSNAIWTAYNAWGLFQMASQSPAAQALTPNMPLWKLSYFMQNIVLDPSLQLAALLVFGGLAVRRRAI